MTAPDGSRIGTLCLIDNQARTFSDDDQELLLDVARLVEKEIHTNVVITRDPLTNLLSRAGFENQAEEAIALCRRLRLPATLMFIDLDDFKQINDKLGHLTGDKALQQFSQILRGVVRESDLVGRFAGDEFIILLIDADEKASEEIESRLEKQLKRFSKKVDEYQLACSVGRLLIPASTKADLNLLIEEADLKMYKRKKLK